MAGEDSFLALSLFTATTTFLLSDNLKGSNFIEFCVMGYCFKASEGIAYLEWLRVDAEAVAADLDRADQRGGGAHRRGRFALDQRRQTPTRQSSAFLRAA